MRKLFSSILFLDISEPISAAWDEPSPGRKLHSGEAASDEKNTFRIFLGIIFIFFRAQTFCSGSLCFFMMLVISEDVPNRPLRRGRSGSFICKFSVTSPRKPDRRNI